MKNNETYSELYTQKALQTCKIDCAEFRKIHEELIVDLIYTERWEDVTNLFFKQGFLQGLKFNREMSEQLTLLLNQD